MDIAYKTVRDHVVLLQYRRGHLSVHVIVVFDERLIAHPRLLSHEDGGFDYFAKACRGGIACLKNHGARSACVSCMICLDTASAEVKRSAVDST